MKSFSPSSQVKNFLHGPHHTIRECAVWCHEKSRHLPLAKIVHFALGCFAHGMLKTNALPGARFGTSLALERIPLLGLIAWSSRRSKAYTTKSVPSRECCGNFLFRNAQCLIFLLGWHLLGLLFVTESAKDVFYPRLTSLGQFAPPALCVQPRVAGIPGVKPA